jgi:hypothetical protein
VVKRTTVRHRNVLWATSGVLVIFGFSDFYEAQYRGALPVWLWVWKIGCALLLLACRFQFIGWDKFNFRDRSMRFGLACLLACILGMILQHWSLWREYLSLTGRQCEASNCDHIQHREQYVARSCHRWH